MYPVLVYGTLRPGSTNYDYFLNGFTYNEETVLLDGFTMHASRAMSYPFINQGHGRITATLVHINADAYEEVIRRLDRLEGVRYTDERSIHNLYNRELHTFIHQGEQIQAWIYIPGAKVMEDVVSSVPVWENGDWMTHPEACYA